MRGKWLIPGILLLCCGLLPLQAQDVPVRYSYYHNGYAYVSTEREAVPGVDFSLRLEKITLPGGSTAYRMELRFDLLQQRFLKGTSFSARTVSGKIIRAGQQLEGKTARAQYFFEEDDIRKMAAGVTAMEVSYDWTPDGFLSYSFKQNEFGALLSQELSAIRRTPTPAVEIGDRVARYAQQTSSTVIEAKEDLFPEAACQLRYIYYPSSGKEDYDLTFRLVAHPGDIIPFESPVVFSLSDGSEVTLLQQQAARGALILYPTAGELRSLFRREILSIRYSTDEGQLRTLNDGIAQYEGIEMTMLDFSKAKASAIEGRVNSMFRLVRFKMFDTLVNGTEVETCVATVNGVPYGDGLNSAQCINGGIDIINAICNHVGVRAPIFIDNAESVNELLATDSQLVRLVVSNDKQLTIS